LRTWLSSTPDVFPIHVSKYDDDKIAIMVKSEIRERVEEYFKSKGYEILQED